MFSQWQSSEKIEELPTGGQK